MLGTDKSAGVQPGVQIGDGAAGYERRANHYRPSDPAQLAHAVRALAWQGLRPVDIAQALRVALPAVLEMLREPAPPPRGLHP